MYGWEFPPFHSGGLGVACQHLTEELIRSGVYINFVLPHIPESSRHLLPKHCLDMNKILEDGAIYKYSKACQLFSAYISSESYEIVKKKLNQSDSEYLMPPNLIDAAHEFGEQAKVIAQNIDHDVIHSHDWLTFAAGINTKKYSNKPFIVQVHSTEFDRSGGNPNPVVYDIERYGMEQADSIVAVSHYTKQKIMDNYGIPDEKITVIHNGINNDVYCHYEPSQIKKKDKIVLFLGRITLQKGPDYFLYMAKRILEKMENVKFIMAGDGDMMREMIRKSIHLGIEKNIVFTGFLQRNEINKIYQNADLYVMPSVSEPFGLTTFEAMKNGTPVLISKQSGVSEVVKNALKVDFWDIDEMANKALAVLKYPKLSNLLKREASYEIQKHSWKNTAEKLKHHYQYLTQKHAK